MGQDRPPWNNLGLSGSAQLGATWSSFHATFTATADEARARLSFTLGAAAPSVELADVVLAPGGREGLREDESLERANVALFGNGENETRASDRWRFLVETEKTYFDGMRTFLKQELGTRALVTGTMVYGLGGLYAQTGMDYIDSHAYWQHPSFPGKPWDPANWRVEQKAMVDSLPSSTLNRLSPSRLAGMPFTVSEYNHPAPNDFQAECIPLIASYAAAQDWDGIWLFDYGRYTDGTDGDRFATYFTVADNPSKWGFVPAGAALFRLAGLPPFARVQTISLLSDGGGLTALAARHASGTGNLGQIMFGQQPDTVRDAWLSKQLAVALGAVTPQTTPSHASDTLFAWRTNAPGTIFSATSPSAAVCVCHTITGQVAVAGGITVTAPAFAAVTLTALDALPLARSRKLLVTACGRCENLDMAFSPDRRTVGRGWGTAPVRIEAVTGRIQLPPGDWICHALYPDGTRGPTVDLERGPAGEVTLTLSPAHQALWYLVEPRNK